MSITITHDIENQLEDKNICFLNGSINEEMADYVIRFLIEREFNEKCPELVKLFVSSGGGSLEDTFGIIDVMKSVSFPIYTYSIGKIYSGGLFIFMTGTKGHRYIFRNTSIMSHQWSGGAEGKKHELLAADRGNKLISDKIMKHYIEITGMTKEDIEEKLLPPSDIFLSPQEAIRYHLADKIIKNFNQ